MSLKGNMKILGLALMAVFAFSAVSAGAAQAEEWTIEGTTLSATGGEEEIESSGGPFALTVPKLGITITCQSQTSTGHIYAGGTDDATVEFTVCNYDGAGACKVTEPIIAVTNTHLTTVGGTLYDFFEPSVAGGAFTTIELTGCALAGKYPVKGNVAALVDPVGTETVHQPLTFSEAISKAAGTELKFGANPAFLTGSATVTLSGTHAGLAWGAE